MITEIVLWRMPDGMSREEILTKFKASVPTWQANPNLIHKAFVFDEKSRRGGGVYLWNNIEAANQAHGTVFQDRINAVFGAKPRRALMAPAVACRAFSSKTCPSSTSVVMTAAASK